MFNKKKLSFESSRMYGVKSSTTESKNEHSYMQFLIAPYATAHGQHFDHKEPNTVQEEEARITP